MTGLSTLSKRIADHGRYGDDEILHVSKAEIAGLDALARNIYGHPLTRNPATGQKEAFLFLPFLAGLGSAGLLGTTAATTLAGLTGGSALGAGALSGILGATEAAARGMDDPLKHGVLSAVGGYGSAALGNAAQAAAGGAGLDAATQVNAMGQLPNGQMADLGAMTAAQGAAPAANAVPMLNERYLLNRPLQGSVDLHAANRTRAALHAAKNVGRHNMQPVIDRAYGMQPSLASASPLPPMGGAPTASTAPSFDNWKSVFTNKATADKFLSDPNTSRGVIATGVGMAGQSQLETAQGFREADEARDAEKERKYNALRDQIKQRYADAGRTGWWEQPGRLPGVNFANGGQIPQTVGYTTTDQTRSSSFTPFVSTAAPHLRPSSFFPFPLAKSIGEFDPEGAGYDYETAISAGMKADGTGENLGHWGSVAPVSEKMRKQFGLPEDAYLMLKGYGHETWPKAVAAEEARGSEIRKVGPRYFSVPKGKNGSAAPPFADGGQVFQMQSGGFVIPKYAVDAVGGGNNDRGLVALKRKIGAKPIRGKGTGTSDSIPAKIDGKIPAKVSNGEAYAPPASVKRAGGTKQLYGMMAAAKAKTRRG